MRTPLLITTLCLLAIATLTTLNSACTHDTFADESSVELHFSTDTLSFDTVFTTVGTTTRILKVYNRSHNDIRLSTVTLAGGRNSRFRLNVDGDTSMVARNVELLAGDSIFIFVQANINPNDLTIPFLVEDAILFGNGQRLPLVAWGRNAVYHSVPTGAAYSVIDCDAWDHSRPHIILGTAAVLDGSTLQLTAGDEIYFGPDGMLAIDSNASLIVQGTAEQPVLFTSMRHDGWYSFLPGQWQCIFLTSDSQGNRIDHAIVENGTGGIRAYPNAEVIVSNTLVRNMSDGALIGQGGSIEGENLLVYDCLTSLTILSGGNYHFAHCTMADYWSYSGRKIPSVVLSNYLTSQSLTQANDLQATFTECIIYGSYPDTELLLLSDSIHRLDHTFTRCHVKGLDGADDPLFADINADDYRLQEGSPATGLGYRFEN